jgi:alkylation response protein AidB-like acyl-CoA dehydrogenase
MDFSLSPEQQLLKQTAKDFLAEECPTSVVRAMAEDDRGLPIQVWQKMAQLGWMGLPFPEKYGGTNGSLMNLMILVEQMGFAATPGPFFTAVLLGGMLINEAGNEEQKAALLPRIAKGDLIVTLASLEPNLSYDPDGIEAVATPDGDGYAISGTKILVPDVRLSDYMICAARTADAAEKNVITLFLIPAPGGRGPGIKATALPTMSGTKQFEVVFDNAHVSRADVLGAVGGGWKPLNRVLQIAAVGKCVEAVGGSKKVLEMDVAHGHGRVQFGVPIGSFQAVQHHCTNIKTNADIAEFLTYQAAFLLDKGEECTKQVSMAKAFVGDAYTQNMVLGHQVLGGVGLMIEHDIYLYSRRGPAVKQAFGSSDHHRELVVRQLGL